MIVVRRKVFVKRGVFVLPVLLLLGCNNRVVAPPPVVAPVVTAAPAPAVVRLTAKQLQDIKLGYLLDEAEAALGSERLMLPEDDNALMWFQAALRMDPNNTQASSGVQQIVVHYAQAIRDALAKGRVGEASAMLQRLQRGVGSNPLLAQLQADIGNAHSVLQSRQSLTENMIELPASVLAARSESLIPMLHRMAVKAKAERQMLLIHARNDGEGRWIYQQMREAVPGYRLRADIVVTSRPGIAVLPTP